MEIESTLNNRLLTYQGENPDEIVPIRPIDFVQNKLVITYSFDDDDLGNREDPNFLPPEEAAQLRTQNEAKTALHASQMLTNRFWKLWKDSYLTSLREQHRKHLHQGTENPNQIGQVELRMPRKSDEETGKQSHTTRIMDSDPGHEHIPTHENRPTPTELPSEPSSETSGRPKRNPSKQYPYSPEECEINSISIDEKSVIQSNTSIFRMQQEQQHIVDSFLHRFAERRSMFNEDELKRRESKTSKLQDNASHYEPVPQKAKPLLDKKNELLATITVLKQRWEQVQVVSSLLWEVYDKLAEDDPLILFSRQAYERRPREGGRLNSKEVNGNVIRDHLNKLKNTQGILKFLTIDPFLNLYIEKDEEDPYVTEDADIHTKLDDIEKLLQRLIEDTNTTKQSPDIESILRKLHRIESMLLEEKAKRTEETTTQQLLHITTLIKKSR
ncbi:unnamed protein product [Cylicocyclus nassatus]|uniref:DUF5641 domain-containing protein n=1 Tax=Cylicocyclus nassatus TaxID=53992 RepID=A0AA36H096_CYLNA|nr:unnamed protein product [Cylicocyclus nassatus]